MYQPYYEPNPLRMRLQQAAWRKSTRDLLERVAELEIISFAKEECDTTNTLLYHRHIADLQPFSKLWWEASEAELREWLLSCFGQFGIERQFSLVVGGLKAEVKGDEHGNWLPVLWSLPTLWSQTNIKELAVLSSDGQRIFALFTEEYFYSAVMLNVADISSEADTGPRYKR